MRAREVGPFSVHTVTSQSELFREIDRIEIVSFAEIYVTVDTMQCIYRNYDIVRANGVNMNV